jgi:Domain of unknown function (DUF5624)
MPYQPDPAFAGLFRAFTGQADSIGGELTRAMMDATAGQPLLVSTASDIAFFAGNGAPAQVESFRKSTRGFIELTAVSHVPLALAYVARLYETQPSGAAWRTRLESLVVQAELTRTANSEALWRDQVALDAFAGIESKIAAMVERTLAFSVAYAKNAIADPGRLAWEALRRDYLERRDGPRSASMNDVMFATFCLAYIDIAFRIGNWLRGLRIDWRDAMVLVSGQSGRPTAGVTWSSNNMCNLVWQASDKSLPAERLFVAPHAPGFSVAELPDAAALAALEQTWRRLWCHTRASIDVSRNMFRGENGAFVFDPELTSDMPPIASVDDRDACVARLRRIMEDPTQLLSNCVADYVVEQLRVTGNRPQHVVVPGFTNLDFEA